MQADEKIIGFARQNLDIERAPPAQINDAWRADAWISACIHRAFS